MANRSESPESAETNLAEEERAAIVPEALARPATAIAINRELTDDVMRQIGSGGDAFDDAMRIAAQLYGEVQDVSEEFGSGFQLLADKSILVGKKLLLLKWNFSNGDYGVFASAAVVTFDGGKYIINDGSTGLGQQLRDFSVKSDKYGGMVAPRGLRVSSYATCKACGKPRTTFDETCENTLNNGSVCGDTDTQRGTGETYYLDLSA